MGNANWKWPNAFTERKLKIGRLRPNANPNVFVPEKEIAPEKMYQKKKLYHSKTKFVPKLCTRSGKSLVKFLYQEKSGTEGMGIRMKDGSCNSWAERVPRTQIWVFGRTVYYVPHQL
jgi:hypothetical protein